MRFVVIVLEANTLAAYLLRLPNNDDMFSAEKNRPHAQYRDLLEQMKGKNPSLYYTDVLVEQRKTQKRLFCLDAIKKNTCWFISRALRDKLALHGHLEDGLF